MAKAKSKIKKRNSTSNKSNLSLPKIGSSHIFAIIGLAIIVLLITANIQTKQNLTASAQSVLGEDEQSEEQKQAEEEQKESEKQAEEEQDEAEKQEEEQEKEDDKSISFSPSPRTSIKSKTETNSSNNIKTKTEIEDKKEETEIETADGQKIKTKIEDDGTTKIEVENGSVKLKYKIENGQVVINVENEDGEELELEDEDLEELEMEVEDVLEDDNVRLIPSLNNQLALTQNNIAALTNFPLSINIETKELIITTPAGQKIITVLPDEAVENLLNTGIINKIDNLTSENILSEDQINPFTGIIKIETYDDKIVYKVKGEKTHRVFGIIPINAPVTAFVSTDSGLPIAKEQSLLTNFIDLLSP